MQPDRFACNVNNKAISHETNVSPRVLIVTLAKTIICLVKSQVISEMIECFHNNFALRIVNVYFYIYSITRACLYHPLPPTFAKLDEESKKVNFITA